MLKLVPIDLISMFIADLFVISIKLSEIFELFIAVASGAETKSEALGFGNAEFVPWQIGAVM